MKLDLILKDIEDEWVQENFFRLTNFFGNQPLLDGDFKLFDITIPAKSQNFKIKHGLTFIPADIIPLSITGDFNFYFKYQNFDREFMYVVTNGPVRIRFLAGKLKDPVKSQASAQPFPFVAPGDIISAAGPSFVYGAVGDKTDGFWLTSEGIPSNVAGVPVLFGDATVILAAVGAELDVAYTIGIYQHNGNEDGLAQIGTIPITIGGPKRFNLLLPIANSSPNVQLACRLESGNTRNLKVSLVVRGTSI